MIVSLLATLCLATFARGQYNSLLVGPGSVGVVHADSADPRYLAHPAVVRNAEWESQLPSHLLNDFYKNPQIGAGLARESLFTDKEFPVLNRQAEKIPRSEIAKIIRRIQHSERRRRSLYR